MGKKKIAGTKNVYELAQERLKVIFNEFDNIYVSFSGGKDNTSYYVSGSYLDQPGVLIGTEYKRYTFKVNFDTQVKDWLRIGTNISAGICTKE